MSRSATPLEVGSPQRRALEEISRSQASPMQEIVRARALLLAADGLSNVEISRRCGVTPRTVATWRSRFTDDGVDSVRWDRRGRVPPVEAPDELVRLLTRGLVVVTGLYLSPAQQAASVRAVDGAAGSDLRLRDGPIRLECPSGTHRDLLYFLKTIDRRFDDGDDIPLLLDRLPGQVTHFEVNRWLANPKRRRFHVYLASSPRLWERVVPGAARPDPLRLACAPPGTTGRELVTRSGAT